MLSIDINGVVVENNRLKNIEKTLHDSTDNCVEEILARNDISSVFFQQNEIASLKDEIASLKQLLLSHRYVFDYFTNRVNRNIPKSIQES